MNSATQRGTIYRGYVLGMLFLAYAFNYIDRILLGIVQEPIKAEFGLTDFQLGLLGGPAFAILYTLLGIPIARRAERTSRVRIITFAMLLWSSMTALCGLSYNYLQLLLTRLGVSIGEAGLTPPAQSVIADYFPASIRTTALGIYSLGVPVGAILAAFAGGGLAEHFGWRMAFIIMGLPGILIALIIWLTIKEPPRAEGAPVSSLGEALRILLAKRSFRNLIAAASLSATVTYGIGQYLTSFVVRAHSLALSDASKLTGITIGIFAGLGTFLGGYLSDRLAARQRGAIGYVPAVALIIATPAYMLAFASQSFWLMVVALFTGAAFHYVYLAPMYAMAQGIATPRMRATAVALLLLVVNLVGYGIGPPLVGAASDWLMSVKAIDSSPAAGLRRALVLVALLQPLSALYYWRAGRTLDADWLD